jgi:hypothetical protein
VSQGRQDEGGKTRVARRGRRDEGGETRARRGRWGERGEGGERGERGERREARVLAEVNWDKAVEVDEGEVRPFLTDAPLM